MATYPKMTLAQLRTASRQRADMVNSTFISDPELNSYINASYYELYDLLVQKYGNDYFMKEYSFQLQGNISQYPLPADFFKLLGVDLQISDGPDGYVSLRPFTLAERNRYSTANVQTWIGVTNLRYRISAGNLWFTPSPQTGQTIRIWYVPRLAELVDATTPVPQPITNTVNRYLRFVDFLSVGNDGDTIVVDGTTFTARTSPSTPFEFAIGTSEGDTASNFLAAVTDPAAGIVSNYVSIEQASGIGVYFFKSTTMVFSTSSTAFCSFSNNIGRYATLTCNSVPNVGDTFQVENNLITCIDNNILPSSNQFVAGPDIASTMTGLYGVPWALSDLTASGATWLWFAQGPSYASIDFYNTSEIYVGSASASFTGTLYGTGTITPPVVVEPNTVADGISGWLEYVVTDAAIKMLQKEESDTSVLQFQKAALIKRIESAAENRDAGSPATIADVQWTNGTWPFGNGFGGGGGIP